MSQMRIQRINDALMRAIGEIIRELKDTRIPLMTSVVAVDTTNDLRYAKVRVSVMGDGEVQKKALAGLNSAAGYIRREMGRRVDLRYTPELVFELDHSIEHGAHINSILHEIEKKEENQ